MTLSRATLVLEVPAPSRALGCPAHPRRTEAARSPSERYPLVSSSKCTWQPSVYVSQRAPAIRCAGPPSTTGLPPEKYVLVDDRYLPKAGADVTLAPVLLKR